MDQFNALPNVIGEVGKVKVARSQRTRNLEREDSQNEPLHQRVDNTHNIIK